MAAMNRVFVLIVVTSFFMIIMVGYFFSPRQKQGYVYLVLLNSGDSPETNNLSYFNMKLKEIKEDNPELEYDHIIIHRGRVEKDKGNTSNTEELPKDVKTNSTIQPNSVTSVPDNLNSTQVFNMTANPTSNITYLCVGLHSGFGNQLYTFASAYGIAKSKGMKLVVSGGLEKLHAAFYLNGDYNTDANLCKNLSPVVESACCKVADNIANLPNNKSVSIHYYLQSYKYFEDSKDEIKRVLTFRDSILNEAKTKLEKLLAAKYVNESQSNVQNKTLVGVHIRRGDYTSPKAKKYGYRTATKEYIYKAQDYMRRQYDSVTFVLCSNDLEWSNKTLENQTDVIIAPMGSAAVDMALLTMMDHMIITVGTYSFWTAWLNPKNGTVIYYKDFFEPNSGLSRGFANPNTDTYYPYWIGMT